MPRELPPFSFSQRVSAESAKHDKISLEVGGWRFDGSVDDIQQLRDRMSVPDSEERTWEGMDWSTYAMIFNRPPTGGALSFRDSSLPLPAGRQHAPLWSGKWRFSPFPNSPLTTHVNVLTHLDVSFNPTRFLRNQNLCRVRGSDGQPTSRYTYSPRFDVWNEQDSFNGEFSLNGKDNWLPCGDYMEASTSSRWSAHLRASYMGYLHHFQSELARVIAFHSLGLDVTFAPYLNLKETETYWEFASFDPWADMKALVESVNEFSTQHRSIRTFETMLNEEGRIAHSRSITIQVGAGRELVIYAKTSRRIRLEVRHRMTGRNPFRIVRNSIPVPRNSGGGGAHLQHRHTSENWETFFQFMAFLTDDAVTVVNRFLEAIESHNVARPVTQTGLSLLTKIMRICTNSERALTLVHMLAHDGKVHRCVLPETFDADLAALRRAGVLMPKREGAVPYPYVVTADYEGALRVFQQLAQPLPPQSRIRRLSPPARTRSHR